jgi:hypothetical protein
MDTFNTRRYEMLVRVRDFGLAHSDLFPPSEKGGEAFAQVTAAVAALSENAAAQISGDGTTTREIARAALRNELDAIAMTARALAIDRPGLGDQFWLPRRGGDQTLLSAARAFLREAVPLEAEFVRHAMPADFPDPAQGADRRIGGGDPGAGVGEEQARLREGRHRGGACIGHRGSGPARCDRAEPSA